jgi:thymidylate synthase (FAD)
MHTAKLDWITPDAERVIAKHARVSTSDPEREEYARLLSYCIKHGHWSVLEQANASFEIITSRAISAQLIRHKSLCFQELSQRYCNPFEVISGVHDQPSEFSIRKQAEKNRQSSTEELDTGLVALFRDRIYKVDCELHSLYNDMLKAGVARECARNILPLYTPTRLHAQGTIRSWVHYVGLRGKEDTQLEHQLIARQIAMLLDLELPTVVKAVVQTQDPSLDGWRFLSEHRSLA